MQAAYSCVACYVNIVNSLPFEVIQAWKFGETKMRLVLRTLQVTKPPEGLDIKGV